jgi:perosamine synthetase
MIQVNEPLLNGNEKKYLNECIDTGWISSEGPFIKQFEERMALTAGRKHGIAVCNGSVALDLAVQALGIGAGDEVILPSFTIISCAAAIVRAGAVPVFVDADAATWNIDTTLIEQAITPRTKAIMVVHIYGLPCDMDKVIAIAQKHNLFIIEDAAEMHGQTYNGKPCGGFGDVSTFSFYPNKHVTTGEGGMVLCNNDAIADKCRSMRNLCFIPERRFKHEELGYNFRMTNLQAALGMAQAERLDEFIIKKRTTGKLYDELLSSLKNVVQLPLTTTPYANNIYWVYAMVVNDNIPLNAQQCMDELLKLGIGTRPFFYPMHQQPVFKKASWYTPQHLPVSERIAEKGFYIPSGMTITTAQQEQVADAVHKLFGAYK